MTTTHTQKVKIPFAGLPCCQVWPCDGALATEDGQKTGCVAHVSPSFLYHPFPASGIGDATATMLDRKGWSLRTS